MKRPSTIGIVVHHTVTANNITQTNLRNIFKSRFGVNYIGYNYVILADGTRYTDIGPDGWGIHSNTGTYQNHNSVGISLAGNFETQNPTKAQLATLSKTIQELMKRYNLPKSKVVGHRDTHATACPGKNLYKLKPWIGEDMATITQLQKALADMTAKYEEANHWNRTHKARSEARLETIKELEKVIEGLKTNNEEIRAAKETLKQEIEKVKADAPKDEVLGTLANWIKIILNKLKG
jgi:N-acetylmuramoyl-L-alanine amidase CwlA